MSNMQKLSQCDLWCNIPLAHIFVIVVISLIIAFILTRDLNVGGIVGTIFVVIAMTLHHFIGPTLTLIIGLGLPVFGALFYWFHKELLETFEYIICAPFILIWAVLKIIFKAYQPKKISPQKGKNVKIMWHGTDSPEAAKSIYFDGLFKPSIIDPCGFYFSPDINYVKSFNGKSIKFIVKFELISEHRVQKHDHERQYIPIDEIHRSNNDFVVIPELRPIALLDVNENIIHQI